LNTHIKQHCIILFLFICILFSSCASDRNLRKKQAEAFRELGAAYMVQGDYGNALEKLLKARRLDNNNFLVYNYLGLVFMTKNKYEDAILYFKKAIRIKPTFSVAKNNLGTAYCAVKNWNAAIEIFREVTEDILYPTPHYPLANTGWAYFNKKNYLSAEKFYLDALEIAPDFLIALHGLGRVYIRIEEYEKAKRLLKKVIELAPDTMLAEEAQKKLATL